MKFECDWKQEKRGYRPRILVLGTQAIPPLAPHYSSSDDELTRLSYQQLGTNTRTADLGPELARARQERRTHYYCRIGGQNRGKGERERSREAEEREREGNRNKTRNTCPQSPTYPP